MKKTLVLLLLFLLQFAFSQNGYQVKIKLENTTQKMLFLSIYSGTTSKTYVVDSVALEGKKEVVFSQKQKILGGIFQLSFQKNAKMNQVNINIENASQLVFNLKGNNLASISTSDPLNKHFLVMQTASDREERKKFFEELVKKFPQSAGALYAKLELKELNVPKDEKELKIYRDHFFVDVDLNDKRIKLLPNIYSSLFNYVKLLPITNENYKASINNLLRNQDCNSPNYLFYLKWVFMNLEYLSKYYLYDSYNYVFNTYLNSTDCMSKDQAFYNKTLKKLQQMERLPLGSKVPNVEITGFDGENHQLSSIYPQHDYTFIIFYDPDCSHCQEKMPEIQAFFKERQFSKDVKIVTFLNVPFDEKWKSFVTDYKMNNWLNVKSENNDTQYQEELDVFENPSYLLLNREGEVVLKNYHPDEFQKMFK